jgi:hypothetical protein
VVVASQRHQSPGEPAVVKRFTADSPEFFNSWIRVRISFTTLSCSRGNDRTFSCRGSLGSGEYCGMETSPFGVVSLT